MSTDQPLDLDAIEARAAGLYEYATGLDDAWQAEADVLAGTDVPAMAAEIRRLRARVAELETRDTPTWRQRAETAEARVTELEGPAVEARAALAALCYDLEDPGTAALGALYLISQATTGVEAPRDDAAEALARHDADVIRKAAQVLEETDRDDDAVNLLYLIADGKTPAVVETHVVADDSDDPEHVDDCPGCEAFTLTGHITAPAVRAR